jgi:hypothetical protein
MRATRFRFWAVTHVIALAPCTPSAAKVLKSAWMPASPPLSEPAMVKAAGMSSARMVVWQVPAFHS